MLPTWLFSLLLQISETVNEALPETAVENGVDAAADGGGGGGGGPSIWLPLIAIFAIFYFLIIRPEGRKRKEREKKVGGLKKGDKVITSGGLYGEVVKTTQEDVTLEVDKDNKVRIRFAKSAVLDVLTSKPEKEGEKKAEEAS